RLRAFSTFETGRRPSRRAQDPWGTGGSRPPRIGSTEKKTLRSLSSLTSIAALAAALAIGGPALASDARIQTESAGGLPIAPPQATYADFNT
ncbi:hypothetical protein ABTL50_19340, partial [Acinetobacter baumannii]